jgi:hypothetical protein
LARDTSGAEARQAMQAALTRLTMEIAGLKDNLAAAEKSARAQNARLADLDTRVREKLARDQTLVTGSIAAPKTAAAPAAAPAPAPVAAAPTPLPQPRPALAEASPRSFVAEGWSVLGMRRGFLYVQNGRDVFRVLPGARLPGLGIVEDIRREDGEWIVVTRRGVIPAGRERL